MLAENDDNKKKVGEAGGIDVILRAMEQHLFHPYVERQACCALSKLALDDENRKKIRGFLRAKQEHPSEERSLFGLKRYEVETVQGGRRRRWRRRR